MTKAQILPLVLIVIQAGASVPYLLDGDYRKGFYWLFATGLTVVVTF